jgi:hypothetical protein
VPRTIGLGFDGPDPGGFVCSACSAVKEMWAESVTGLVGTCYSQTDRGCSVDWVVCASTLSVSAA